MAFFFMELVAIELSVNAAVWVYLYSLKVFLDFHYGVVDTMTGWLSGWVHVFISKCPVSLLFCISLLSIFGQKLNYVFLPLAKVKYECGRVNGAFSLPFWCWEFIRAMQSGYNNCRGYPFKYSTSNNWDLHVIYFVPYYNHSISESILQ